MPEITSSEVITIGIIIDAVQRLNVDLSRKKCQKIKMKKKKKNLDVGSKMPLTPCVRSGVIVISAFDSTHMKKL